MTTDKKTIFFDIDGTIYDEDKNVPASTREAIAELQRRGHNVVIATGRGAYMFKELREELGIDSFVSLNGQYVVYKGKVIYTNRLETEVLKELTLFADKNDHPVAYIDATDMKVNTAEHVNIVTSIGSLKLAFPTYDAEYFLLNDIYQAIIFCPQESQAAYEEAYPELKFVRWHPLGMDVLPGNGSKANGIAKMLEILGVDKADVYAFGDGLNDLEMLSYVGHGIAMGNAEEEVKAAAAYVTRHVSEDGIYEGLKMVGLL
ncbi:phosphatase [Paenibacillus sp. FSL R7-0273]|uniref:Cof-type HAD-IIB family hydrolase n=1 Tax=Paenibacillus sp. FSL R7-0273 TaxID=1536772 RepID=UPI0004F91FB5|nr:Cof-type HAD-IIB family hydrolase [Paenibacillus sp. FSL R7-0273]AIQ49056.1 phosphatase [Paenibacillus sp. FSL R7-0273]OMF90637.1 phosphatase [Paenibacillus sp. FSL R7-0273]